MSSQEFVAQITQMFQTLPTPCDTRRANARNVTFSDSLRWQIHIIKSPNKIKLT